MKCVIQRWRWWLLAGLVVVGGLLASGLARVDVARAQETEGELTLLLASPAEGETFYLALSNFLTSVPIAGQVISYDAPLDLATVSVTVELIDAAGQVTTVAAPVDDTGYFSIWANISRPGAMVPTIDIHEDDLCLTCHTLGDLNIPPGEAQVVVHVQAQDGRSVVAARRLRLDHAQEQVIPVRVEGLPPETDAALIQAATTIYNWRPRLFLAPLEAGQVDLLVEAIDYADLVYTVTLEPVVVGGTHYTTLPQTVVVPAGGGAATPVTLAAVPALGQIDGRVVDAATNAGVVADVLAVNLANGAGHTVAAGSDGTFALADLPVAEYALLARAPDGFHLPARVDLHESLSADPVIHLVRAGEMRLTGMVTLDGAPLPFAQVTVDGLPTAHVDPVRGTFVLDAVTSGQAVTVEVAGAGAYGARIAARAGEVVEFALDRHDDLTVLEQGGTRLYLPAASDVTRDGDMVTLTRGVLWVTAQAGASGPSPYTVQVADYTLTGQAATFALEALGGEIPRLYVSAGTVEVMADALDAPLIVSAGQTLALADMPVVPVDLVDGAGPLLRALAGPVATFVEAPTAAERAEAALLQVMVVAARVMMLGAYAITFVGMPLLLVVGLIAILRRRNAD